MDGHQQDLVAHFSGITGANPSSAQTALESANWNLEEAVSLYYAAQEENAPGEDPYEEEDPILSSAVPQSAPAQPSSSSNPTRRPPGGRPKQMTLEDLKKMQEQGDDDSDEEKKQDMFAGGEKSGLAVQNPNQGGGGGGQGSIDHFQNIMNQARQNRDRPQANAEEDQPQRSSNFTGRAQTLGGDEAESRVVEDPSAAPQGRQPLPRVARTLHLWADGVSIDDGPLFRFDDPANQGMMAEINRGRAPLALLDVQPDQEVDLNLIPHKDENYIAPKKKYKPFSGQGQRLGSPTPGPAAAAAAPSSTSTSAAFSQSAPISSTSQPQPPTSVNLDESAPTIQLQIRLGDGTRLQSRFNTTHTIGDVYDFVNRASAESNQRAYALMTTFPSKELEDKAVALGEMADFKRGGVVVQKWK